MNPSVPGTATVWIRSTSGKDSDLSQIDVHAGQSIQDGLVGLGLASGQPWIAVVNGATEDMLYVLQSGDVVHLLPQIAGG
jgi:molybdopterin converting factor small subunit